MAKYKSGKMQYFGNGELSSNTILCQKIGFMKIIAQIIFKKKWLKTIKLTQSWLFPSFFLKKIHSYLKKKKLYTSIVHIF